MDERDLLAIVAADLAAGKIVGWFQGRSEIGPRALGNRSILADARDAKMKDHINARVKHREPFRPFGPAVLQERAAEFFDIDQSDPFMTTAPRVRTDKAQMIPAAVHVDGTARIQTVDRTSNPRFYGLIKEFAELTGIPVILNTSFNRQEPIVARPAEAISCYLRTQMDVLVLGDFYVTDRNHRLDRDIEREFLGAIYPRAVGAIDANLGMMNDLRVSKSSGDIRRKILLHHHRTSSQSLSYVLRLSAALVWAPEVANRCACRDQECFRATLTLWPRKPQFVPRAGTKFEKF